MIKCAAGGTSLARARSTGLQPAFGLLGSSHRAARKRASIERVGCQTLSLRHPPLSLRCPRFPRHLPRPVPAVLFRSQRAAAFRCSCVCVGDSRNFRCIRRRPAQSRHRVTVGSSSSRRMPTNLPRSIRRMATSSALIGPWRRVSCAAAIACCCIASMRLSRPSLC